MPLPKDTYGKFYDGDAYIIYSCAEYGEPGGLDVKPRRNAGSRLEQHIHFWIGEKSSQDEVTVAAYKSVELGKNLARQIYGRDST